MKKYDLEKLWDEHTKYESAETARKVV